METFKFLASLIALMVTVNSFGYTDGNTIVICVAALCCCYILSGSVNKRPVTVEKHVDASNNEESL